MTDDCVMNATIRIAPWQAGHARGSTSKTCWRRAAQRRLASVGASRVNDRLILPRERSSQIPHPVDLTPQSEG
jgi:hypothetical protein